MAHKYLKIQLIIFVFCFTIIGYRAINISANNCDRARNSVMGDGFSDANTLSSAHYFLDSGFTKTKFLPVHDYSPSDTSKHAVVYTHYPALPNILAGLYAVTFQTISEPIIRIIPIFLAAFFFFYIYYVLKKMIGDETKAFIGACTLWICNYFICWSDNIHQHLYGELLKWIYIYGLYVYYEAEKKHKYILLGLLLIMIAEVNISFEQPVFLGIATLGFSIVYTKKIFSLETILAALAVFVGFGIHLWQNALYLGTWEAAINDLIKAYTFRATGAETVGYVQEREFTWANLPEIPFDWFNRMERFYAFPGWAILIVFILCRRAFKLQYPKLYKISYVLFFASIAWTIIMAQHAHVHSFTNKHFSIWYALISGICLPIYFNRIRTKFLQDVWYKKTFHVLLISYGTIMFLTQQVWMVWLQFGILFPKFGR